MTMTGIRDAAGVLWPGVPIAGAGITLSQDATGQTIIDATGGSLDDLDDVELTAPAEGEDLVYNGSEWVNQPRPPKIIGATFDGGGAELDTSTGTTKVRVFAPCDLWITAVAMVGVDGPGDLEIGIKKCSLTDFLTTGPGALADITGGNNPTVSSAHGGFDVTLTGWTGQAVAAGDVIEFELIDAADFTQATIQLFCRVEII